MKNIEKGIPIPDIERGGTDKGKSRKYGWHLLNVGDSMFFEGSQTDGTEAVSARMFGANNGMKFAARKMDGGTRIWRIE